MKKWKYIAIHIFGWSLLLTSNFFDSYTGHSEFLDKSVVASGLNRVIFHLIYNFSYLIDFMVSFYGAYFFVAPFLFFRKRYLLAFINLIMVLAAMVVVRYAGEFYLILTFLKFHNYFGRPVEVWPYIKNCILYTYRYCLLGIVVYSVVNAYRLEKEKKEIEKEKIEAELSLLKSQVNPHFLFNTINDIYALTYRKDDQAPEALLKLSSILRYMLHESGAEFVPLEKELTYLKDYIELQHIGLKGNLHIDFTINGNAETLKIAPLLLIPFAENIFKHGVINESSCAVQLHIDIDRMQFRLRSSNQVRQQQKDSTGGIGLSNVQRRLALLYPGKHHFTTSNAAGIFTCHLDLNLE